MTDTRIEIIANEVSTPPWRASTRWFVIASLTVITSQSLCVSQFFCRQRAFYIFEFAKCVYAICIFINTWISRQTIFIAKKATQLSICKCLHRYSFWLYRRQWISPCPKRCVGLKAVCSGSNVPLTCSRWTIRWSCCSTRGRTCWCWIICTSGCTTACPTRPRCTTARSLTCSASAC